MAKYILLCFLSISVHAFTQLKGDKVVELIDSALQYQYSKDGQSFKEVKTSKNWRYDKSLHYVDGQLGVFWGKFTVTNDTDSNWIAEFTDHRIDEIIFYYPNGDSVVSGDQHAFRSRLFLHKNFEFRLLNSTAPLTYYFRINSAKKVGVRIMLKRVDEFLAYSLSEYLYLGFYYGILFIIIVLNFLIYLKLRLLRFLFYSCYVFSLGLFSACQDGLFYQYLWPFNQNYNNAYEWFLYLYIVFELLYTASFFELKHKAPKLYKVIIGLVTLRSLFFVYELCFGFYDMPVGLDSVHLVFVFCVGLYMYRYKKYSPAKYFVLGFSFMLFGYLVYSLVYSGLIPVNVFTVYAIQIGAVFEFCVLTLAFTDQIRFNIKMRLFAQQRMIASLERTKEIQANINEELERKVLEKTQEISVQNEQLLGKNKELEELNIKLWDMNAEMDKLNWRLSKDVEDKAKKQVDGELVLFDEFKKIYASENKVYQLLHSLKKERTFVCKSCSNPKSKIDDANHLRICTQCGYRESATANTLIHGVRINKIVALYLVYRFTYSPKTSVKELAIELSLRLASIYNIRKKVFEVTNEKSKKDWKSYLCK